MTAQLGERRARRMLLLLLCALGPACGPTAEQLRERELCYSRAESAAQERVDAECSGSFATCPVGHAIVAELQQAQEACP